MSSRPAEAALDAMYAAWAEGDAAGVAACYTADATAITPATCNTERDEIRAFFAAGFAGRLAGSRVLSESRSVRACGADSVIVSSQEGILMAGERSLPPGRLIRSTWVLTRRDGQWLIAAFHSTPLLAS
jgi:uncharacterized protein (TIGR02246 family)